MELRYTLETCSTEFGDGLDVNSDEMDGWGLGRKKSKPGIIPKSFLIELLWAKVALMERRKAGKSLGEM